MEEFLRYPRPAILADIPRDGHVVIEASAGTGKTHTLEHLVVDLLLSGEAKIDEILIVTFTEPATAELKARVRGKLEDLVRAEEHRCGPDEPHWEIGPEQRHILQQQLDLFGRSSIHTIHGFCHRILMENAFHLRRLFDEEHTDSGTIFDMAFKAALRGEIATDPDLRQYLLAWLKRNDLRSLADSLAYLATEDARLAPGFYEEPLRKALDNLARLTDEELVDTQRAFRNGVSGVASGKVKYTMLQLVEALVGAVRPYGESRDLAELLAATDSALAGCLEGVRWEMENVFRLFHDVEVPAGTTQLSLKHALVRLIPLRTAVIHKTLEPVREQLRLVKQRGHFDYDDMLRGVWDRIGDRDDPNGEVMVRLLRSRYKLALIDEFQDTDPVQWNIFKRIFFESPDAENRLFVIGDPKQAIYGFRGADVDTYIDARRAILEAREESAPVRLRQNFRSTATMIAAYNRLLDQRAPSPFFTGAIQYDAPVECGRPGRALEDSRGEPVAPIQIARVVPSGDRLDAYTIKRTLGMWMAREVRRILDEGLNVVDREDPSQTRPVGPDDIYMLTRSGTEARKLAKYLRELDVPFAFYKEEGLFQSAEARHVLDLLHAIDDPSRRANRFRAWSTPFFDVPFERLAECAHLPETDPLVKTLLDWHELAKQGRFERLFASVLDDSGVVRREIFRGPSERELTNILHLFEILLEEVHRERASTADLIVKLHTLIENAATHSDDRNIQRLETDRKAVQLMTIHKSKGLEAEVVFLYGGFSKAPQTDKNRVCRQGDERVVYMGLPQSSGAMMAIEREMTEENQRLLYVAATRARSLLYLPFIGKERGKLQYGYLNGTYEVMNNRLLQVVDESLDETIDEDGRAVPLFRLVRVEEDEFKVAEGGLHMPAAADYSDWRPPTAPDRELSSRLEKLRRRPLVVSSYSRMKRTSQYLDAEGRDDLLLEIDARAAAWADRDELPSGADTGIFLHDILERIDFATVRDAGTFEKWVARPDVDALFVDSMSTHGIEERYAEYSRRVVWATLASPLTLPGCAPLERLADVPRDLREIEFLFPIPERGNPTVLETPPADVEFDVRRGYIKGFIDLVFEYDGRVFFADWKSDSLETYGAADLREHVTSHYETQAWLYSIAVLKMFGIHDEATFEERFGGYMYAFLRGVDGQRDRGFFVHRPTLDQIASYEQKLRRTDFR